MPGHKLNPDATRISPLRAIRPRRAGPAEAARVTRAEINLAHARHNLHELRACLAADSASPAQIWAVLKADGYGHGATAIATTLERSGVDGICVALLEEGIELRNAGITCPVLVMGGYFGRHRAAVEALVDNDLTPVVYAVQQIDTIASTVRYLERGPIGVHLKVDTGMGRLGVREDGIELVLAALRAHPELRLEGVMTHLACADGETLESADEQLERFERATATVKRFGFEPGLRHAANSAAMLRLPAARLDLVRPGIAVFGVHPCRQRTSDASRSPNLKPVMRVLSEIVALRELPPGESLGYGHTWTAQRPSRIATVPIGYADGLARSLSNSGEMLVCGRRAPIVGAVSMDLTMIDVTDIEGASVCDEVVVIGEQKGRLGQDAITADEVAAKTNTISWECLTAVSRRVPRFFRLP